VAVSPKKTEGFTLIEVLVALAILSIALTAIIKSTSQNIKDTLYLQNKTIAMWTGTNMLNEIRAGILIVPAAPDHLETETESLGQQWICKANVIATPNPKIKEINVDVYEKVSQRKLAHLVSYVYNA